MTQDIKERLHDGSYRVRELVGYDSQTFKLIKPIEYAARCTRLASGINRNKDNWRATADKWIITINSINFDYYTGVGLREHDKPVKPELSSILHSLVTDAEAGNMTFRQWCDDFGYNVDSIQDRDLYLICQATRDKLNEAGIHLNDDLIEFMQEF